MGTNSTRYEFKKRRLFEDGVFVAAEKQYLKYVNPVRTLAVDWGNTHAVTWVAPAGDYNLHYLKYKVVLYKDNTAVETKFIPADEETLTYTLTTDYGSTDGDYQVGVTVLGDGIFYPNADEVLSDVHEVTGN